MISHESILVGYLLESGWKLHLSSEGDHAIFKRTTDGTKVDRCEVSADAVLELHQSGRLRKQYQLVCNGVTTTVFDSEVNRINSFPSLAE